MRRGFMGEETSTNTSATLLARLRLVPADQAAWGEFTQRYGRKIYGWCRRWNLQDSDAEDVTQNVLLKLAAKMQSFVYDPTQSFRGWLKTVARNTWNDYCDSRARALATGGSQAVELLHTVEAREDLINRLGEEFDRELLDEAAA